MNDLSPQKPVLRLDPELRYYDQLHSQKYRDENQPRQEHIDQIAHNLASDSTHYTILNESLKFNRFLPAGRVQASFGATEREVSPFNCSVSQKIEDNMNSIMDAVSKAAMILRLGTGIGYNFSNLRPLGAEIKKLKTKSSGPLSFMKIFDVMASTIASSGHRRGAQMGILNVSHPDIEAFISAKMEKGAYRQFNLSVGITDDFMECVKNNSDYPLTFGGQVYRTVKATELWEKITKNAYDSAEPGIIFIDRLNQENNLYYCEHIEATNPCAEQPLPPYGLCTLGSFNLVAYIRHHQDGTVDFNHEVFKKDIHAWVEAYDNIFDEAVYAIPEHEKEAKAKRRIGLGLTGIANAIEYLCGKANYGEPEFCEIFCKIAEMLRDEAYDASANLAIKRGPFTLFDKEKYLDGVFIKKLPDHILSKIKDTGIRNSHLISYAPCGTISQCALNVSSGVEPVFYYSMSRDVHMKEGKINITLNDFMYRQYGFKGKTLDFCSVVDHLSVAKIAQEYCDSAVSKTINVSKYCTYEEYVNIYLQAHELGLKGITIFRPTDIRGSVITEAPKAEAQGVPVLDAFDTIPTGCVNGACTL